MAPTDAGSATAFTRRNVLKLPGLLWFSSLLTRNSLAKALWPGGPVADDEAKAPRLRREISLNKPWKLTYGPCPDSPQGPDQSAPPADWPTIDAAVPGNVELDLVAAGRMEPLERGNRAYQALKLESYQWWYRRSFDAAAGAPGEKAELVFDGLDCLATIWLNGKLVGQSANMLVPQRFEVTSLLAPDRRNEVVVRIDAAVPAGRAAGHSGTEWAQEGHWESLHIRKAPHMYGWDIMPRIVSAGLWKEVRLEWTPATHIASAYWFTRTVDVAQKRAVVEVNWEIAGEVRDCRVEVELLRNGRSVYRADVAAAAKGRQECPLANVDFWWPRGFGEQPLYQATVKLRNQAGEILDGHAARIGVRTIELDRTDILTNDGKGKFGFQVNGIPVFIKGADYSCLDALHSRDRQHVEGTVALMAEANCNMARCWGGNVYPEDRFFDLCDEAGIMVWQDFAMACAVYPKDNKFLDAIEAEARAVVPRLRNHASLALWSGNNECDDACDWDRTPGKTPLDPNGDLSTRVTIPGVLKELDPHRAYLPSSPYHSPAVFAAGNGTDSMPEVHLWGPRGYFKAPFYTASPAHFASEIGYHGCPSRSSLERMMDAGFVEPWVKGHEWNDQWLTKSVRATPDDKNTVGRNDLMINQVRAFFGEAPETLDDFILASQITQAEAMKFFVELFRQQKGLKQGILWWNIRDGWPILSDAVVDYYNNKKLAFHYLKAVQQDVQAIVCEAAQGQHAIVVVNDTRHAVRGSLVVSQAGHAEAMIVRGFEVEANGKATVGTVPHPATTEMWGLRWDIEGMGSHTSHYLATSTAVSFAQYKDWMKEPGLLPS